jgi:hypothetical protein
MLMGRCAIPSPVTSTPSIRTRPEVGCANPATIRSKVVLPQPDGPSKVVSCLGGMRKWILHRARTPLGNVLLMDWNWTALLTGHLLRPPDDGIHSHDVVVLYAVEQVHHGVHGQRDLAANRQPQADARGP